MVNQDLLKEYFEYNGELGRFIWKKNTTFRNHIGKVAGNVGKNGYRYVGLLGKIYLEHKLVWIWHTGNEPKKPYEIDHINRDRTDNKIENLRVVTRTYNNLNCGISKNNSSGANGVAWHSQAKKWRAYIMLNYKQKSLGLFESREDAIQARHLAEQTILGKQL